MKGRCTRFGRGGMIRAVACLLSVLGVGRTVSAEDVSAHVHFTTADARTTLDRSTGLLTSTVDVTLWNLGGKTLLAPLHVVVDLTSDQVQMPGASGGPGDTPYGAHYLDLSPNLAEGRLKAGAQVSFVLTFVRDRRVDFTYDLRAASGLQPVHAPVLAVDPMRYTVEQGQTLAIELSATDPDGDVVRLSGAPFLRNASLAATTGIQATGTFRFTPDTTQAGFYAVTFTARDPLGLTDAETVDIEVIRRNRAPVLAVPAAATVREGDLLTVDVGASDPDGDPVTVGSGPLPAHCVFGAEARRLTFAPDFDQAGEYAVQFTASDGVLAADPSILRITVVDVPAGDPGGGTPLVLDVDPVESPTLREEARITGRVNTAGGAPPPAPSSVAVISGMNPTQGRAGETLDVLLIGFDAIHFATHFTAGVSRVSFGDGITVDEATVAGSTRLSARVRIAATAAPGPRQVTVTTGRETAVGLTAFRVMSAPARITGRVVNSESGLPIAGAIVSIEGTGHRAVTGPDGSFTLEALAAGNYVVLINPPDAELLRARMVVAEGADIALGDLAAAPTVFDPDAPAAVSLLSVVGRGMGSVEPMDLAAAEALVTDTILLVGGTEAGVLDRYGNQLNPDVAGAGAISLNPDEIRLLAQRMERGGDTVALVDVLYGFSWGLRWEGNRRPSLQDWLEGLQEAVDAAWRDPANPDHYMPILLFNRGRILPDSPPTVSPETRLNPLQAYLLSISLFTIAVSPDADTGAFRYLSETVEPLACVRPGWRERLEACWDMLVPTAGAQTTTNDVEGAYRLSRYTRGFFSQRAFQMGGAVDGNIGVAGLAFKEYLMFNATASMPYPNVMMLSMNRVAVNPLAGSVNDALTGALGFNHLAARVPEPPPPGSLSAVVTNDGGRVIVDVYFRKSRSHGLPVANKSRERYLYSLYRWGGPDAPRELVEQLIMDATTIVTVDAAGTVTTHVTLGAVDTAVMADFEQRVWRLRDAHPLPEEIGPGGEVVTAAQAVWNYALTVTVVTGPDVLVDPDALSLTAPWWSLSSTGVPGTTGSGSGSAPLRLGGLAGAGYFSFWQRTRQALTSDYTDAMIVRVTPYGQAGAVVDEIELHPDTGDVYYSDRSGATADRHIARIEEGGLGDRSVWTHTGFADPGHRGLAMDASGTVYTDNEASDALFGGRIFRFSALGSGSVLRDMAGSINYYSREIQFAHPVAAGPMAIGPGLDRAATGVGKEVLYVVDEYAKEVKKADVQEFAWDPYRRVGKPWADIPFGATSLDLEVRGDGDADLLVERVASAGLTAELTLSDGVVSIGDDFIVRLLVSNPSLQPVNGVYPLPLSVGGEGETLLTSLPDPGQVDLAGHETAAFAFGFRALQSGTVTFQGQAQGADAAGYTISSLLAPPAPAEVEIGSPLQIVVMEAQPAQIGLGGEFELEMILRNRGRSPIVDIAPSVSVVRDFLERDPLGGVVLVDGPSPEPPFQIGGGEDATVRFTYAGEELGFLALEGQAAGVDTDSGSAVDAFPKTSNDIVISPLALALRADPVVVRLDSNEVMNVTLTVENTGLTELREVTPTLEAFGTGRFQSMDPQTHDPITLAAGASHDFRYTFRVPLQSGGIRLDGSVTARTPTGRDVPSDPVSAHVAIGPVIKGTVHDVVLTVNSELTSGLGGVLSELIDPVPNLNVVAKWNLYELDENGYAATTDENGEFLIAVPSEGPWVVTAVDPATQVGFALFNVMGADVPANTNIVSLPVSLVNTTLGLVQAMTNLTVEVAPGSILSAGISVTNVMAYHEAADQIREYVRQTFQRGVETPRYWEVRNRPDPTLRNEWDALIRLDAGLAFNLRRFQETADMTAKAAEKLLSMLITSEAVSKHLEGLNNYHPQRAEREAENSDFAPRMDLTAQLTETVLQAVMQHALDPLFGDLEGIEAQRYDRMKFFIEKMTKVIVSVGAADGLQDMVMDELMGVAMRIVMPILMQEYYIDEMTEPVVLRAVDRARALDMPGMMDTLAVLRQLVEFDALVVEENEQTVMMFDYSAAVQGWTGDINDHMSKLADFMENTAYTNVTSTLLADVTDSVNGLLKYVDMAESAVLLWASAFDQPGRTCIAFDQIYSEDPLFWDNVYLGIAVCNMTGKATVTP